MGLCWRWDPQGHAWVGGCFGQVPACTLGDLHSPGDTGMMLQGPAAQDNWCCGLGAEPQRPSGADPHGGCTVSLWDVVLCRGRRGWGHVSPPALHRRQLLEKRVVTLTMSDCGEPPAALVWV